MINTVNVHIVSHSSTRRISFAAALFLVILLILPSHACATRVLVVGDLQYSVVAEIVSDIRLSLKSQVNEYPVSQVRGRLGSIVEREGAQVVVALGLDAVGEALNLPPSIAVVYGLVVVPPINSRGNVTGVYMSPPVSEYLSIVRKYLPSLGRVTVVGSQRMMKSLLSNGSANVSVYQVGTSSELLSTVNRLSDTGALLLLPDANLLTTSVMENIFLFSFRNDIPLLGISEVHVKNGSLFSFVFDPKAVSRQIVDKVQVVLNGADAGEIPASPPGKYNLFINNNTARKMGIQLPDELLRKAKKVYQ